MESTSALQSVVQRVVRYAPATVAARYPLPIHGGVDWQSTGSRHQAVIDLPELATSQIVVPSFSMLSPDKYGFQFAIEAGRARWALAPINQAPVLSEARHETLVTHVDYFEARQTVDGARLVLNVESPAAPAEFLLTLSIRNPTLDPVVGTQCSRRLIVSPVSQMTAPRTIRHHLCSPTSMTMVLRHYGVDTHLGDVARRCYHADSGMFGVWPCALHTASRGGCIGAVETFDSTDSAVALANAGIPLVASIRFGPGELSGAPQQRSAGHLLVVTGWDAERVYVNDPRATDPRDVCTSYDRTQFVAAWLSQRGAGYVVLPP